MLLWFVILIGCGARTPRTGLVVVEDKVVTLVATDGQEIRLGLSGDSTALRYLNGFEVALEGSGGARRLNVRKWRIVNAGFGPQPFVGRLRRYGSNWLVDDQTTGSTLMLVEGSMGALIEHDGDLVVIEGLVVGAHRVQVISWRALAD